MPPASTATHSETDGQETPLIDLSTAALLHAPGPPLGSVELRMPASSPATHSDADGQEMAAIGAGIGLVVSRQAANPL